MLPRYDPQIFGFILSRMQLAAVMMKMIQPRDLTPTRLDVFPGRESRRESKSNLKILFTPLLSNHVSPLPRRKCCMRWNLRHVMNLVPLVALKMSRRGPQTTGIPLAMTRVTKQSDTVQYRFTRLRHLF